MDYDVTVTSSNGVFDLTPYYGIIMAYSAVSIVVGLALYVYSALALMTIAKKTNTPNAWLAWIPIANFYLMTQIAKVPWWTFLIIFLSWIPVVGALLMVGVIIWWWWKISEARNRPGWWSILMLIPIVNIIILGMLAWSDKK
jgi:hypothetical protein